MPDDKIEFRFECPKCGGTILELPDNYTDNSTATCKDCGVPFGRWGDIKAKALNVGRDFMRDKLKSVFKGSKGWKIE